MLEIACDESGYEGQRLIGATIDVFAHGSVAMDRAAADECMAELRRRIKSPATEYKATHLLRTKHRAVLEWLLGGPLAGCGHVFLIDKAYFVVSRLASVLAVDPAAIGRPGADFLVAANNLLWTKDNPDAVQAFSAVAGRFGVLHGSEARAEAYRAGPLGDPDFIPPLEPLIPSLQAAVRYWGPSVVVHDRQTSLTPQWIGHLRWTTGGALEDVRLIDSFTDSRVQMADVLAGVARKIASEVLNGRGDPRLTQLLWSYVDADSIWGDATSWAAIKPL